MFNLFKKKSAIELVAMCQGEVKPISQLDDFVFSKEMMGQGFFITPEEDPICSPVSGVVTGIFPTKHAISLLVDGRIEVLLHMGLDTVELKGAPFEILVSEGQTVKAGDELARMDREQLSKAGKSDVLIVVFPSSLEKRLTLNLKTGQVSSKVGIGDVQQEK